MDILPIPKPHKEKFEFRLVHFNAYEQSELTLHEFFFRSGIVEQSFRKWVAKLRQSKVYVRKPRSKPSKLSKNTYQFIQMHQKSTQHQSFAQV